MDPSKSVAELLDKVPAGDAQSVQRLYDTLLADNGAAIVEELVELVGDEFGDTKGAKPKYVLHGLVMYAARPDADGDGDRQTVAETLAKLLDKDYSDERKAFLCRQLQLCGRSQEIPALAKLLASDRLCEPATQALSAIGDDRSLKALRDALPKATGNRQATLKQAVELMSR